MKKVAFAIIAALVALTACGGAQAAPLNKIFATPSGQLVNLEGAVDFDKTTSPAELVVTRKGVDAMGQPTTYTTTYADAGNVTYAKAATQATVNGFFKAGTSTKYLSATSAENITCNGTTSQFSYGFTVRNASDNCAARNAAASQANP